MPDHRARLGGRGEHLADGVEEGRVADVLVGRGRDDRDHLAFAHRPVERVAELVVGELLAIEIPGQEVLIGLDDRLDELLPVPPDALGLLLRQLGHGILGSSQDLPVQQVDGRPEVLVLAQRHVQRHHPDAIGRAQLPEHRVEVGVLAVEAPDDDDPRHPGPLELGPNELRPDLHSGGGVHEDERGVRDTQGRPLVAGEVGVPRRVEEIDLRALVRERRERHIDGDVAFLLFGVGVQDARALVDLAEARRRPERVEDRLDQTRLPRSAMADDGHISDLRGLR